MILLLNGGVLVHSLSQFEGANFQTLGILPVTDNVARAEKYTVSFKYYHELMGEVSQTQTPLEMTYGELVKNIISPQQVPNPQYSKGNMLGAFYGYFSEPDGNGHMYYAADIFYDQAGITKAFRLRNWDIQGDATLYALYNTQYKDASVNVTTNKYLVFNPNGGMHKDTTRQSNLIEFGTSGRYPLPTNREAPTRAGYTFAGYNQYPDGSGIEYFDKDMKPLQEIKTAKELPRVVHAQWKESGIAAYTVTLDSNGGSGGTASVEVEKDSSMPLATAPTRVGYNFVGYWDTKESTGGKQYYNADMSSANKYDKDANATLYARWQLDDGEQIKQYTVTLDPDYEGSVLKVVTVERDKAMPQADKPVRQGFSFLGFFDESGKQYYDANMVSRSNWDKDSDYTLKAKWKQGEVAFYKVTLNKNGGSGGSDFVMSVDGELDGNAAAPFREGYVFLGYYNTGDGDIETAIQYLVPPTTGEFLRAVKLWSSNSDGELYARWQVLDEGDKPDNTFIFVSVAGVVSAVLIVGAIVFLNSKRKKGARKAINKL